MSAKNHFDVIVIGVGSMGSAACYYLAKQGLRVLGLEQFDITHDNGSHGGQSRLIRKAYYEHPDYVPLLKRAYHNWQQLEKLTGEQVYFETGIFYAGPSLHPVIQGVHASADMHALPLHAVEKSLRQKEYSVFHLPGDAETFIEPEAGFLRPVKAIQLYVEQAIKLGAQIKSQTPVLSWNANENGVQVQTVNEFFTADKLVITAGAFVPELLPQYNNLFTVTRQCIAWVTPPNPDLFALGKFPCWVIADHDVPGIFYGFPVLPKEKFGEPVGLKLAHHVAGEITDARSVNRSIQQSDEETVKFILRKYFSIENAPVASIKTCLYTNTPDEDFIIDFLPGHHNKVVVAAGFSGHGFKFASVVGEVLADLAINGSTQQPVAFLQGKRFESY